MDKRELLAALVYELNMFIILLNDLVQPQRDIHANFSLYFSFHWHHCGVLHVDAFSPTRLYGC